MWSMPNEPKKREGYERVIEVIRDRRDHFLAVYFQHESRAQFLAGIGLAVAAAWLSTVAGRIGELWSHHGLVLALDAVVVLGFATAFLLTILVVLPLRGRHLFEAGTRREGVVDWLGLWIAGSWKEKPADAFEFAEDNIFHKKLKFSELESSDTDRVVLRAECYNLWAARRVALRRAGILRRAIWMWMAAGVAASIAYLWEKDLEKTPPLRVEVVGLPPNSTAPSGSPPAVPEIFLPDDQRPSGDVAPTRPPVLLPPVEVSVWLEEAPAVPVVLPTEGSPQVMHDRQD